MLIGIPDAFGLLKEGEVFCRVRRDQTVGVKDDEEAPEEESKGKAQPSKVQIIREANDKATGDCC